MTSFLPLPPIRRPASSPTPSSIGHAELSSPFGEFASVADAVNPMVMDYVRNRAFTMFDDSAAARGGESTDGTAKFDRRRKNFVRATRGIHW